MNTKQNIKLDCHSIVNELTICRGDIINRELYLCDDCKALASENKSYKGGK